MASKKNSKVSDMSEKVQEIKRMQRNWFDQRALSGGSEKTSSSASRLAPTGRGSKKGAGAKETTKKQDTVSWVSGHSKKKPMSVRARSASPARSTIQKSPSAETSSRGKRAFNSKVRDGRPLSSGQPTGHLTTSRSDTGTIKESENPGGLSKLALNGTVSHAGSEPNLNYAIEPYEKNWDTDSNRRSNHSGAPNEKSDKWNSSQQKDPSKLHSVTNTAVKSESTRLNGQSELRVQTINQSSGSEIHGVIQSKERKFTGFMEPDAFDKLADKIASKVKADLKLERNQVMQSIGYSGISVIEDDESEETRNSIQSSHKCDKCKQLMVAPDHTPTVLIPCGHTLCEACAEDRIKCPTCRTRVASTTINSTLQQVISAAAVNSHSTSIKPKGELLHASQQPYTPLDYSNHPVSSVTQNTSRSDHRGGQAYHSHLRNEEDYESMTGEYVHHRGIESEITGRRKISPEEQAEKYVTEYQNLMIRCEAMEGEEEEILAAMERKNREIAKQKKQVWNISTEQDRLKEEVRKIEERVNALDTHRREYEQHCQDLEEDKTEQSERLTMVRDMLRGLERNKEKVKLLARNYNISLE